MPAYSLPIYPRPETGIYCLHTSFWGKQYKRTLHTKNQQIAIIRAIAIIEALQAFKNAYPRGYHQQDKKKLLEGFMSIRKFEADFKNHIFKTDGTQQDSDNLLRAMEAYNLIINDKPKAERPTDEGRGKDIKLADLLEEYKLFKKLAKSSQAKYEGVIEEFSTYVKNRDLNRIRESHFLDYQRDLFIKKQSQWTVQGKTTIIKTLFDFAIKKKYYFFENIVSQGSIMTKRDKLKSAFDFFDIEDIHILYSIEEREKHKAKDIDYYFVLMIALLTGARVNEITTLKKHNIKHYNNNIIIQIYDSKTKSGERKITLPPSFSKEFQDYIDTVKYPDNKLFKYKELEGKGAGNAVGKKFARTLQEKNLTHKRFVFHSIRKFFNNHLRQNGVSLEMRCQVLGHSVLTYENKEINDVNIDLYSKDYELENIINSIEPIQKKILLQINM